MQESRSQQQLGSTQTNGFKVDAEERVDLYTVVREMREVIHGETRVSRAFIATHLKESEKNEVDLETAFNNWRAQFSDENQETNPIFTGFLSIRGPFSFHLLESDSKSLNAYLKHLHTEFKQKNTPYESIQVLAFNEENPSRFYSEWGACKALHSSNVPLSKPEKSDSEVQDRIFAIYNMFCQSGVRLRDRERNQIKKSEKRWNEVSDEIAISNDDFSTMINARVMSIDDYYMLYLEDLEIELDNELQFPQHPTLLDTLEYKDNLL